MTARITDHMAIPQPGSRSCVCGEPCDDHRSVLVDFAEATIEQEGDEQ